VDPSDAGDTPIDYTLEHLAAAVADAPDVAETDVVLEADGDRLLVSAHVPTDERRKALLDALGERWSGDVVDRIEVLATMASDRRSAS
jgi:hypothetical protein